MEAEKSKKIDVAKIFEEKDENFTKILERKDEKGNITKIFKSRDENKELEITKIFESKNEKNEKVETFEVTEVEKTIKIESLDFSFLNEIKNKMNFKYSFEELKNIYMQLKNNQEEEK